MALVCSALEIMSGWTCPLEGKAASDRVYGNAQLSLSPLPALWARSLSHFYTLLPRKAILDSFSCHYPCLILRDYTKNKKMGQS